MKQHVWTQCVTGLWCATPVSQVWEFQAPNPWTANKQAKWAVPIDRRNNLWWDKTGRPWSDRIWFPCWLCLCHTWQLTLNPVLEPSELGAPHLFSHVGLHSTPGATVRSDKKSQLGCRELQVPAAVHQSPVPKKRGSGRGGRVRTKNTSLSAIMYTNISSEAEV